MNKADLADGLGMECGFKNSAFEVMNNSSMISLDNASEDENLSRIVAPYGNWNFGNRKIACFRKNRVTPVAKLYSLDPVLQPKAWLDVMASIHTSREEKNEAMEEILTLAKDKNHARIFLEEGILDSLMWILGGFFKQRPELLLSEEDSTKLDIWNNRDLCLTSPRSSDDSSKLAARVCVSLSKAHCAVVHT